MALPQINEHLNKNNLLEPFQSGYKALHSTETALLRVKNDIMQALDRQHATFLVLLDLSAAFDTIDYPILLRRLSQSYNITGHALGWIQSYLTGRTSQVCVSGTLSNTNALECGLPQGSVVSPNLFTLYTGPIAEIIHRHKLKYHLYADDAQLYIEFNPNIPGDTAVAVFKLQACIRDLKQWMTSNKLQLNEQKTEFFMTASKHNLKRLSNITLTIGDAMIEPSPIIRNLGVVFDSQNMSMSSHVNTVSRSINFHLRNLNRIRRYIDTDTCKHATRALILSRLDYSNSLLCNSTAQNIQKLQVLQNRAARLVYRVGRREHASPLLTNFTGYPSKSESCTRSFCLFTSVFTTAPLSTSLTSSTTLILLAISVLPRINQDSLYIELTPTLETLHFAMRHRDVGMPYHSISEEQRLRRPSKAYSRPTSTPVMIRLFIFMAHFIMFMTLLYYCLYSAVIILL